jgi:hypothetical protein
MNDLDLEKLLKRPRDYQNIDGVGELSMGAFALLYSLLLWLQLHAPATSIWHQMYAFIIYWTAMSLTIHYGSRAIKRHITYPRTGFVEYRSQFKTARGWAVMAISVCTAALVSAGLALAFRRHFAVSVPFSLFGLLLAVGYIWHARSMYWKWVVFLAMIAGTLAVVLLPANILDSLAGHSHFGSAVTSEALGAFWLTWLIIGALFLVSGGTSLWLYLRHTQAPVPGV